MKRVAIHLSILALSLAFAGPACDSGGDGGSGGGQDTTEPAEDTTVPEGVTVAVTAADGGTVATEGDAASVEIPAGALGEDTEITISVEAPSGAAQAAIFDFGPDGTQFSAPVTVTIAFTGEPGEGEKAVLAWEDGGEWVEIPGSGLADGKVSGQIDHFTKFTVIFTGSEPVIIAECDGIFDAFEPCGGDVIGTWVIDDMCYDFSGGAGGDNPFEGTCPEATMIVQQIMTGTVTFDGSDQTVVIESFTMEFEFTYPQSCMTANEIQDCDQFMEMAADAGIEWPCVAGEDGCLCADSETGGDSIDPIVSSYTINGNTITTTDQDGGESSSEYCVQGDYLIAAQEPKPEEPPTMWLLKKQ
jgi:hypothetical protein